MTKTYGPYEPTRRAANLIFVSGQVGIDPITRKMPKTIEAQAHQTLQNLQGALGDIPLSKVVKTTVYLREMNDFTAFNEVYLQYFDKAPRPARVCVGVSDLPHLADEPLLVEIDAIVNCEEKT